MIVQTLPDEVTRQAKTWAFEVLHDAGLSPTCMDHLERYRLRQQQQGATVLVLSWPDGTWCLLALHLPPSCPPMLSGEQMAGAYPQAVECIRAERLPLLEMHPIFHA